MRCIIVRFIGLQSHHFYFNTFDKIMSFKQISIPNPSSKELCWSSSTIPSWGVPDMPPNSQLVLLMIIKQTTIQFLFTYICTQPTNTWFSPEVLLSHSEKSANDIDAKELLAEESLAVLKRLKVAFEKSFMSLTPKNKPNLRNLYRIFLISVIWCWTQHLKIARKA